MEPYVSIVYLTKNGGSLLKESLRAVFAQRVNFPFEVLAVDSGSTDETIDVLTACQVTVYHLDPNDFNFGLTRDYGFELTQGEIVIPISQDAIPVGTDWLEKLVAPFTDPAIALVQGSDIPNPLVELFFWDKQNLFYSTRDVKKWMKLYAGVGVSFTACAIRRSVWAKNRIGKAEMSEDKLFQKNIMQQGHLIFRTHEVRNYHSHTYSVRSLAKRCENEGLGWRNLGITYNFFDLLKDLFEPLRIKAVIYGLLTLQIRSLAELFFPIVKPIYIYKGNNFTSKYVK